MLTIDASVIVAAAMVDEPAHDAAASLLQVVGRAGLTIHLPSIAIVEVAAGIARRTGDGRLAEAAVRHLLALPSATVHDLTTADAVEMAGVASALRLRAGDAVYVAVAHQAGCTLITLDEELLHRATPLVDACSPAAWLAREAQ